MSMGISTQYSFPGLWPGSLFGIPQPMMGGAGACPVHGRAMRPEDDYGLGSSMQSQMAMQMLQQQLMAAMMMQSLLSLLVDYFANQMNQRSPSSVGSLGGGRNWGGGGQAQSWGTKAGGHNHGGHSTSRRSGVDGPRSQNQRGIPNGLRQNAANGARVVREMGFTGTIGGIGHRSGPSDHPHGNAIDVMTHGDTRMGRQVAEHFRQNHDQLGVKYVIYQQQIASPRTGWQWRPMADRGSPTANHMDHPHISFY
jgi:hypothetical protein